MQSDPGKAAAQPTKDRTESEARVPAKIDLKSVWGGFASSTKSKTASLSATTALNDATSLSGSPAITPPPPSTATLITSSLTPSSPQPPPTTVASATSLSITTTTTLSSSPSTTAIPSTITTTITTTTTDSANNNANTPTTDAAGTVLSLSSSQNTDDKTENQNADGGNKTDGEEEPFVMTPAYERLARLLARKRENAAVAAAAADMASVAGENTGEAESEALPQQSHWSKLRTTVQIASVVKQRSKRRYNHHRQDSFLRKFSTRHNTNLDADTDSEDNEAVTQEMEKEVEQKRLCRYVIRPEGTFMMYWLLILTLAVLYNLWTCIAREAFREIQLEYARFWIFFDVVCDLIYLFDILVQFRTGYLEQGLLVYDSKKLSKNYITSGDFKLDVACLIPLDFVQFTIGWHPILRFPRFLKIYRTFRCVHMLESRTPYPNLFRVANLTHILFLGAHWFAAFFYLISEAEDFVGAWTYPKPVGEFAGVTRKYLYSLFWSTLTLTTIGDLPQPTTNWEFVFVIFSYLIGVFIFATIVGQVGNVITNRNASRQEFEKLLDGAKFYMQSHNVPRELQKRVQRWYDYVWSRGRLNGSLDIGSLGMLPDKLKTELALNVNLDTLKKVTIFQECQPEFLHDLVLKMKAHIFTPGDLICRRGEVAREMFIIADGVVEIISDRGTVLTSMSSGDFFGEIGILNLHGGINRRTADVRSLGYSELFVLSREDVLAALKDQPDAEHIIREYGEKRLKEIEAHNKRNSDPTPTPSPGSAPKKKRKSSTTENSLQVGPVRKNKPLQMSNLDKASSSKEKDSHKSRTSTISKRLRELPLGRRIVMPASSGGRSSGNARNNSFLHRFWKNNWSKIFTTRKCDVDGETLNVRGTTTRSGEKHRKSSSSSSSSSETRTRKQGVSFCQDLDGSKGVVGVASDTPCQGAATTNRKRLGNRLSSIINQHKVSHGAKYSAVRPDTSDSDSAYTDSACQPLTKPSEIPKKDCPSTDRRVGGFAGLLSAAGFRRTTPAKTAESAIHSTPSAPHISLTVASPPPPSREKVSQEPEQATKSPTSDIVIDGGEVATVTQTNGNAPSLSTAIFIEDTSDDNIQSKIFNTQWTQQQKSQTQANNSIKTITTNSTTLTTTKSPITGSIASLPGSISTMRSHLTSLPTSSSVQTFSSTFGPASRGSPSSFTNSSRSATTHSFTSSSIYPGIVGATATSRPPITQSYSFSSTSSPSFYSGGASKSSTSSSSTPDVHHVTSGLMTPVTVSTTAKTTPTISTTTSTGLISAPVSGNKFSLLAGRRRGPQQGSELRSTSLDEYRTSTSDVQISSRLVTSNSTFWAPTPAAPPPSYYSSYSVSSSVMHPQVNRWIPGSGSTHVSPLGLPQRSSTCTTTSIENGALLGQTSSSPVDANGKGRREPNSSDKHWQANHIIKDIQKVLDEKIIELQRVYQDSIDQYAHLVRHQENTIRELETQLKNVKTL